MKNYFVLTIVFLLIFVGGGAFHYQTQKRLTLQRSAGQEESLKSVFPDARAFVKKAGAFPYYKAYKTSAQTAQDLLGYAFLTTDVVPEAQGYAGPIEMLVGIDPQGVITKVHVLSHSETSSYMNKLDAFLEQFRGKGLNDAFELGKDIDGISRATITSTAITLAVSKSLKEASRQVLQREAVKAVTAKKPFPWDQVIVPIILFAIAIAGIVSHQQKVRWIALIGGLMYFGLIKSTMVSVVHFVNIDLMSFPSFEQSPLWYMLMGSTILTTFLFGMVFCGSLCPFAAVQEILYNLAHRKKKLPQRALSNRVDQQTRYAKYLVLFAVIVVSAALGNSSAAGIEPFLTLFTLHGTTLAWSLLVFMLFLSFFHFRFWCKYLCPVGACLGLFARFSLYKIKLGKECTGCSACEQICPTRAIRMDADAPVIDYPECILCGKCVGACPREKKKKSSEDHEQ